MVENNLKNADSKKENTGNGDKKNNIQNFVDMQAITMLLHISGNPKTRSEIAVELREIPRISIYRKIKEMEKFGLVRQIIPLHKKRKRNNVTYENTSRNFVITNRGKSFHMSI